MKQDMVNGAKEVLLEAISILKSVDETCKYVVIGGWCPYLRKPSSAPHPGTHDVDILFEKSYRSGELGNYIKAMIGKGYCPSAKHEFQLLKAISVGSKRFMYNIDLLHPQMTLEYPGMFVDHLDLDTPISNDILASRMLKSIVLPGSKVIFEENLYSEYMVDNIGVNLVSFDGMFLTKLKSCQKDKRERDSYDIYLGVISKCINPKNISTIRKKYIDADINYEGFINYIKNNSGVFDSNVYKYSGPLNSSPVEDILKYFSA